MPIGTLSRDVSALGGVNQCADPQMNVRKPSSDMAEAPLIAPLDLDPPRGREVLPSLETRIFEPVGCGQQHTYRSSVAASTAKRLAHSTIYAINAYARTPQEFEQ
jgi:hypothetical protein